MNRFTAVFLLSIFALCLPAAGQNKTAQTAKTTERAPVSYGLVVDNSGSYRLLLDRVISVTSEVVETNTVDDEAFLVTFVSTDKIVLRQAFTDQKSELHDAAENMYIEGGQTAILDAMKSAADYLGKNAQSGPGRTRALVLITDGEDMASGTKIEDLLKVLKEQNIRVMIIAISAEKVYTKILERLAKETGGVMLMPKTKAELTAAGIEVSTAMRTK